MTTRSASSFEVTGWNPSPYDADASDATMSRATVTKTFEGDLTGESTAELLLYQANPDDSTAGAGYVASERVSGRLGDRSGTFVMHHWGVTGGGGPPRTGGHVVPGSATEELAGLTGTVEISVDSAGAHTLILNYAIG